MIDSIRRWFAPPASLGEAGGRHRIILINGVINAGAVFVVLVMLGNLADPATPLRNYAIDLLVLGAFLGARAALHHGKVLLAGIGASTLGFVLTVAAVASEGTVRSTGTLLFVLVIIVSGVVYGFRGVAISVVASSLAVLGLILAENAGMLPSPHYSVSLLHWFFFTITFAILGGVVAFSDRIMHDALKQAEEQLQERRRAEADLKAVNTELQRRVVEVERLQAELREQASRDSLTGLYNRRHMAEHLSQEIARAHRDAGALSVLVVDVDHFKQTNDEYGHHVGDLFLAKIAQLFRDNTRATDIACRFGGEEFVLVLPGADVDSARTCAEGLRRLGSNLVVEHDGRCLSVTLSIGVATYPGHGENGDELIRRADHALYEAKRAGRNAVRVWGDADRLPAADAALSDVTPA